MPATTAIGGAGAAPTSVGLASGAQQVRQPHLVLPRDPPSTTHLPQSPAAGPSVRDRLRAVPRAVLSLRPRVVRVLRRARRECADRYLTRSLPPSGSCVVASVRFRRSPPTLRARRSRSRPPALFQALLSSGAGIGGAGALHGSSGPASGAQQARPPRFSLPRDPPSTTHVRPLSRGGSRDGAIGDVL